MPRKLTQQQLTEMDRMIRNGSQFIAIAYECDVHRKTVYNYARRMGIKAPPPVPSAAVLEGVELVRNGWSFGKAAKKVGVHSRSIVVACRKRNVSSAHPNSRLKK